MLAPFQKDGVSFLTQKQVGLLADQPGTGKTLQMIETIKNLVTQGDILVLAPKVAADVSWPEELAKWSDDEVIVVTGGKAKKEKLLQRVIASKPQGRRWIVTNFETARVRYLRGNPATKTKPCYEEHFKDLFKIYTDLHGCALGSIRTRTGALAQGEQLQLVRLVRHLSNSLVVGDHAAAEQLARLDDLNHRLLDLLQIFRSERLSHIKVKVEAVSNVRANAQLGVLAVLLHRLRHHSCRHSLPTTFLVEVV